MSRNPADMMARYGRQLLVQGAGLPGQMRLAGVTVGVHSDGSDVASAAAEVAARYLAGAGVGALAGPLVAEARLHELDPEVRVLGTLADATPPLVSMYLAVRPYGASIDLVATDQPAGWDSGYSQPARVCTMTLELGAPAGPGDAAVLGTMAADLLLVDLLGIESLPSLRRVRWVGDGAPEVLDRDAPPAIRPPEEERASGFLLAELRSDREAWQGLTAHVESAFPNEACGLVVRMPDGRSKLIHCQNLQDRYHALDLEAYPRTGRSAFRLDELQIARAAGRGEALVGIYHSHCDAGAYMSAQDAHAASPAGQPLYGGVGWLILSVVGGGLRAAAMYHHDASTGVWLPEADGDSG